jgi:DNA-binding response OmpR family regulator
MLLQHYGYQVDEAEDGESGLSSAHENTPDLVILDIGLPGIDGWEVCNQLKSDASFAHTKVLIVTAHTFEEDRARAKECGADGYLAKPVEPSRVYQEVVSLIGTPAAKNGH